MIQLIDTHVHLDDDRFDPDRDAVYERAIASGVTQLVIPATTKDRWEKIFSLADQYESVYPTVGLHPVFTDQHSTDDLTLLEQTLAKNSVVAVGECGLDGFHKHLDYEKQQYFFNAQIKLAKKYNLPLIIHARNAVQDVTQSIKLSGKECTGVIHSYNGSLQQAEQLIDLGYLLSFGGAVTYDRATRLHSVVRSLPLSAIMIETDAPDQPGHAQLSRTQPDQANNQQRNEPAYLKDILTTIAAIKEVTPQLVAEASNANARHLFKLPTPQ